MANTPISGNDILLFIDPTGGTAYELIVCLKSQSITRTTSEIDAKSKCGPFKLAGSQDNTVSFDGQSIYVPTTGNLGISDLHDLWVNKTKIGWKYGKTVPVTGDVVYSGTGFISKLDETSGEDAAVTFTGAIGVYGLINKIVTV